MTNKIIFTICISTIIFFVSPCYSQNIAILSGHISGKEFLELDKKVQVAYAMGLVDGICIAPLFSDNVHRRVWFEECTRKMNSDQIVAILKKYLIKHQEEWQIDMSNIAFRAFKKACPEAKKYFDKKRPNN